MRNDLSIGLQVEKITNGYLLRGYKTNGWNTAHTDKYYITNNDIESSLFPLFNEASTLIIEEDDEPVDLFSQLVG